MKRLDLLEVKHYTRFTMEHFLTMHNYEGFAETDSYDNDFERYQVVYKLKSVVVSKITVIYKKNNVMTDKRDNDTIYGIILND